MMMVVADNCFGSPNFSDSILKAGKMSFQKAIMPFSTVNSSMQNTFILTAFTRLCDTVFFYRQQYSGENDLCHMLNLIYLISSEFSLMLMKTYISAEY